MGPLPTDPEELVRLLLDKRDYGGDFGGGDSLGGFATRLGTKVSKAIGKLRTKKIGKPKLKGNRRKRKKERDKKNQRACRKKCGCSKCGDEENKKAIRKA